MFDNFLAFFGVDQQIGQSDDVYGTFLSELGGTLFGDGLFHAFPSADVSKWVSIAEEAFPELKGRIAPFGHDWLGRIFAVDQHESRKGMILMLEIGTGQVLEIPCNLEDFLNEEIILATDACLAKSFFEEWCSHSNVVPGPNQCIGYRIPLFLGGADDIANLELSDMEVYWGIMSQIITHEEKEAPEDSGQKSRTKLLSWRIIVGILAIACIALICIICKFV